MDKKFILNLKRLLSVKQNIVIFPHKNPDGDALGASLALFHFLKTKGHKCNIISPSDYPDFLKWLPGQNKIIEYPSNKLICNKIISQSNLIFTLDFNSLSRINEIKDIVIGSKSKKILIDHHPNPDDYAELVYSDPTIGSTCEMIYNVIYEIDKNLINKDIASCLYTGIMTDSGSFKFPSTSSKTHYIVSDLLTKKINHSLIHQNIFDVNSFDKISLLSKTLANIKKVKNLNAVYAILTKNDLKNANYKKGDSEGFVNHGLSIKGIILSVILIEDSKEKYIKMSFRSKGSFDVNKFAKKYFNGGGHRNAAGGISFESIDKTKEMLISAIIKNNQKLK